MRGSIRNLKKRIIRKTAKNNNNNVTKIRSKTENRKTVKTYKCSHPSSQNPNRYDTVLTSGADRGFAAFRDQWRRIMTALVKEKPESKQENPKITSEIKSKAHQTSIFDENRKPNANEQKIRKLQWTCNPKNRNSLAQKLILKKISKIPMPPSRMKQSVQSTNHTDA